MKEKYRSFYEKYRNKLYSYLVYLSGDAETSKDILQESFTRHYQHYRNDSPLSPALLFTIARNALVDQQRMQNRYTTVPDFPHHAAGDDGHSHPVREEYERVKRLLKKLSPADQEMFSLAVGGMTYSDIAAVLALSESNVKVRIHRARMKLRQMLIDEEA